MGALLWFLFMLIVLLVVIFYANKENNNPKISALKKAEYKYSRTTNALLIASAIGLFTIPIFMCI